MTVHLAGAGELFGGSVLAEAVFAWPGLGQATVCAARGVDAPMPMGIGLATLLYVFAGNLLADIAAHPTHMSDKAELTLALPARRRNPRRRAMRHEIVALALLGIVLAGAVLLPESALSNNAAARALPPQVAHPMGTDMLAATSPPGPSPLSLGVCRSDCWRRGPRPSSPWRLDWW